MSQFFHPSANTIARGIILGGFLSVALTFYVGAELTRNHWGTGQEKTIHQPVPFSHRHHVAELGIDCRYCHAPAEWSASAGIPATHTCMSCHSQIWADSPMLEPVRASYATGEPIKWNRVHNVPDFVYFNHSIHVNKGVGCETCHGRVDQMPLVYQAESLHMQWCLECHRNPEEFIRPLEHIYTFGYEPDEPQEVMGARLIAEYGIEKDYLTNCNVCHR